MPMTVHRTGGELVVKLEGALIVRDAQGLADTLGDVHDGVVSANVDAAGVCDIDTAILQLMCSLRKTVLLLSFENPSQEFIAAVDRCGLRRELLGALREGR